MNSIQTNARDYVDIDRKCIAQIVAIAEPKGIRIYVAWEWEIEAKKGIFGFSKSANLFPYVNEKNINEAANFGWDISETEEVKRIFSNMF